MSSGTHNIWPNQSGFRFAMRQLAIELFQALDSRLVPDVLLLAFSTEGPGSPAPVCVEPEECGFDLHLLAGVYSRGESMAMADQQNQRKERGPGVREVSTMYRVQSIVEQLSGASGAQGWVLYCSWPVRVETYDVHILLKLPSDVVASHPSLRRKETSRGFPVETSFLRAVAAEFLRACYRQLQESKTRRGLVHSSVDAATILRAGGKRFLRTPSLAASESAYVPTQLFEAVSNIAFLRSEGEAVSGRILIAHAGHPNVCPAVKLTVPVAIENSRAIRKLQSVASGSLSLLSNGSSLFAFGDSRGAYDSSREDLFTIEFRSHGNWQLLHAGSPLLSVAYGVPALPEQEVPENRLAALLRKHFSEISEESTRRIWLVANAAAHQRHGAMLVISEEARSEAIRLSRQATLVEPFPMTPDLASHLTALDGAVLVDPQCICHAIGVILDGKATMKDDPSRGARFNSGVRYVEAAAARTVVLVVSEDGQIDLVPDLLPRLSPTLLESYVTQLEHLADSGGQVDEVRFAHLVGWLRKHTLYLDAEACSRINRAAHTCLRNIWHEDQASINLRFSEFEPNPAPDDSVFTR